MIQTPVSISKRFDSMKLFCIIFNHQCGVVIYGGTMLPGCGKKHTNLSAGSPFEVHMSSIINNFLCKWSSKK